MADRIPSMPAPDAGRLDPELAAVARRRFPELVGTDGAPEDNRIINLRDVSPQTNSQNRKRANASNSNGLLGVSKCTRRGGFIAQIRHADGRMKRIGRFDTPERAHAAYLLTKRLLHEGNTL